MEQLPLTEPVLMVLLSLAEQPRHDIQLLKTSSRSVRGAWCSAGTLYGALPAAAGPWMD